MPTRNVVITDHQQQFIESLVESGRFQNASEVLRDGLRLVEDREARDAARLEALRSAVLTGWDDVASGRHTDVDDADLDGYIASLGQRGETSTASVR
ncbi:MAG: type II toxin-antitoxin system ParD family antitoxin [Propionibacteriaceae bacterium]|jgi:antitoxin ParD1/3/4|nr:type II toxin-antitoxin system ParD family antitoxin [Propionibacteriaceae bacterium]